MSLQKESYDSFKSKRTLLNLTFQKSPPSKRVFLFYCQISMFWTLFKEGIFFISKSQCRELLPKRIISLLKLSMPSTPSIKIFFFSNSQWSCTLGESTKSQRIFMQCILLKTFKIFNFDFLSIAMCMPCKVTWNATLKWN